MIKPMNESITRDVNAQLEKCLIMELEERLEMVECNKYCATWHTTGP